MHRTDGACDSVSPRLLAVLVLYKIQPSGSVTLTSFCRALIENGLTDRFSLLIYDNSPAPSKVPEDIPVPVTYIHNPLNGGVFAAYDTALKLAGETGSDWMLLLDQDTCLDASYLKALCASLPDAAKDANCAALVPRLLSEDRIVSPALVLKWGRMHSVDAERHGIFTQEVTALNSGALIRVAALQRIGGFNPVFWLDYQDHWMFNRLHHAGFYVWILDAAVAHELSVSHMEKMSVARYKNILSAEAAFYKCCKSTLENKVYLLRLGWRMIRILWMPERRQFARAVLDQLADSVGKR